MGYEWWVWLMLGLGWLGEVWTCFYGGVWCLKAKQLVNERWFIEGNIVENNE